MGKEDASSTMTVARPIGLGHAISSLGRRFPPVRLLWIFLVALGSYSIYYLGGLGETSLVFLPLIAALTDLAFQAVRFPRLKFPDAALATGLFVALVLPPTAPLLLTGAAAFSAIAVRHALRLRGRPWFNPAALGIVGGTVLLGLAPAWWIGIGPLGEVAMIVLGLLLLARAPNAWRLPVMFLLTYGLLSIVEHLVLGATTDPRLLLLQVADPATLFFVLFMVPEPRTAPAGTADQVLVAGIAGVLGAFLPIGFPTLGLLLGLLGGNALTVVLRWRAAAAAPAPETPRRPSERASARSRHRAAAKADRWPIGDRITTGVVVVVVLAAVVGLSPSGPTAIPVFHITTPTGGGGVTSAGCQTDSAAIPSGTLTQLHRLLGSSVILSYNNHTGVVVFYDPVNQVTVTETDLYEDYGFADFNGDDYAVAGCAG